MKCWKEIRWFRYRNLLFIGAMSKVFVGRCGNIGEVTCD